MSKKISLPSVPRSVDRDTTVFLQSLKRAIEGISTDSKEVTDAAKNFVLAINKQTRNDFFEGIDEATSVEAVLDIIEGSITESQLSKDLAMRVEQITQNGAAIKDEREQRQSEVGALASDMTIVQAAVGGHSASIQQQSTAIAGIQGDMNATWQVRADVNGLVGGIALGNNGWTVDFLVRASSFAVQGPGGSKNVPFVVYPDGTTINEVYIDPGVYIKDAYIRNAAIDTLQIRNQAVSVVSSINKIVNTGTTPIYSHQTEAAYLNSGGASVLIRLTFFSFDTKGPMTVKIYRDNDLRFTIPFSKNGWGMGSLTESIEVMISGSDTNSSYHALISSSGEGFILSMLTFTATSLKR